MLAAWALGPPTETLESELASALGNEIWEALSAVPALTWVSLTWVTRVSHDWLCCIEAERSDAGPLKFWDAPRPAANRVTLGNLIQTGASSLFCSSLEQSLG